MSEMHEATPVSQPISHFERFLDSREAAALLQIHPKTLQRLARKGEIRAMRIGKLWRFRTSDLDAWVHLRHSFGTLMKAHGEDLKTIQELLRHATFKVTADTYTQAVTLVKRDAQARIAKLIMADGSASKPITPTLQ